MEDSIFEGFILKTILRAGERAKEGAYGSYQNLEHLPSAIDLGQLIYLRPYISYEIYF